MLWNCLFFIGCFRRCLCAAFTMNGTGRNSLGSAFLFLSVLVGLCFRYIWVVICLNRGLIMGDRYDISVDIGDGKYYSVTTLFENGEYRPIALSDTISFGSGVEDSGYVGVEAGELSFSSEVVDISKEALDTLFGAGGLHKTFRDLCDDAYRAGDLWALFALMLCKMNIFCMNPESIADAEYAQSLIMRLSFSNKREHVVKRRKTTYKTVRRDCAKRNRHK